VADSVILDKNLSKLQRSWRERKMSPNVGIFVLYLSGTGDESGFGYTGDMYSM